MLNRLEAGVSAFRQVGSRPLGALAANGVRELEHRMLQRNTWCRQPAGRARSASGSRWSQSTMLVRAEPGSATSRARSAAHPTPSATTTTSCRIKRLRQTRIRAAKGVLAPSPALTYPRGLRGACAVEPGSACGHRDAFDPLGAEPSSYSASTFCPNGPKPSKAVGYFGGRRPAALRESARNPIKIVPKRWKLLDPLCRATRVPRAPAPAVERSAPRP